MVGPEERAVLEEALADLSAQNPWPADADIETQDVWIAREDAESGLAGIISTVLNEGRADLAELGRVRALFIHYGSRLPPDRLARVMEILS